MFSNYDGINTPFSILNAQFPWEAQCIWWHFFMIKSSNNMHNIYLMIININCSEITKMDLTYLTTTIIQKVMINIAFWSSLYISPEMSKRRVCQCWMQVHMSRGIYWNHLWYHHHGPWLVMFLNCAFIIIFFQFNLRQSISVLSDLFQMLILFYSELLRSY